MFAFDKAHSITNSSLLIQLKNKTIANGIVEGAKEILKNLYSKQKSKSNQTQTTTSIPNRNEAQFTNIESN